MKIIILIAFGIFIIVAIGLWINVGLEPSDEICENEIYGND